MNEASVSLETERLLAARLPDGLRPQLMHQRWESLLFLHWQLPAAHIQATLPPGLRVETFGGSAYLGVVPFFMRKVRPVTSPALPWLSYFLELNVRTYVTDKTGLPGVWFYSLDCNQPLAVMIARSLTGLPYFHAQMRASRGDLIDYSCRRRQSRLKSSYSYRGIGEARESQPGSLEFFLLERYYLYAIRNRTLLRAQVAHLPYRYQAAEVRTWSAEPARQASFEELTEAPFHSCFVSGLDVKIFATQALEG